MGKKIVIVGAGYAGILTAKKLAKKFKQQKDISITIIDKNPFHTMLTELHEVAAGRVDEDSIIISLKKVFSGRNVEVKMDTVTSIDYDKMAVQGLNNSYEYDYLVLAAGSQPTYYGVKGAEENTFKLWSYEDAVVLRDHIQNSFRKAMSETSIEEKKKLLNFWVVGAGFTGVEMIGELAEYVPILCEKYGIQPSDVELYNVDGLSRVIPTLTEKLSNKVQKRLQKMGVRVILNTLVSEIGNEYIDLKEGDKVVRKSAGTIIWAAGIQSADITRQAEDKLEVVRGGRIQVDPYLRSTKDESVYVIGDNMNYIPEGEERPVPQMVENCEQSAHTAAHNIICAVTNTGKMEEYKPKFHGVMVSIGGRYGVCYVGLPGRFFSMPSFLAMFAKHFINIIYFIQVLGWNKVFSYVKHEFFTIRNCRSFVGGHFSNRTPSFLLVPLRIWLGAVWLFEGIMKIYEGWFTSPKLKDFFGGAKSWYDNIINSSAVAASADATSSATTQAGSAAGPVVSDAAGQVLLNLNFLDLFHVIFVCGKKLTQATLSDYAFRLDIPLMNWFVNHLILPYNGIQLAMQIFIVLAEILVGLALIGGLFTAPASAFSLILQFMFVCTTGLYLGTFWMIFAGIAVLIGAGRTFGLDYYAMPGLKKGWRKLPFVRKWYIYND